MSKKSSGQYKRRRTELWTEDPKCRLCGVETILPENMPPIVAGMDLELLHKMATIDHLFSRSHPLRHDYSATLGGARTRLLCHGCNVALSKEQGKINTGRGWVLK